MLSGEEWRLENSCFKIAGVFLIIAGNYAYFELRARAKAATANCEVSSRPADSDDIMIAAWA